MEYNIMGKRIDKPNSVPERTIITFVEQPESVFPFIMKVEGRTYEIERKDIKKIAKSLD